MLLSDAVRERGGLGGGVPMFARALNEFMLCPEPCTWGLCLSPDFTCWGLALWGSDAVFVGSCQLIVWSPIRDSLCAKQPDALVWVLHVWR